MKLNDFRMIIKRTGGQIRYFSPVFQARQVARLGLSASAEQLFLGCECPHHTSSPVVGLRPVVSLAVAQWGN